jgi:hypothetical protein
MRLTKNATRRFPVRRRPVYRGFDETTAYSWTHGVQGSALYGAVAVATDAGTGNRAAIILPLHFNNATITLTSVEFGCQNCDAANCSGAVIQLLRPDGGGNYVPVAGCTQTISNAAAGWPTTADKQKAVVTLAADSWNVQTTDKARLVVIEAAGAAARPTLFLIPATGCPNDTTPNEGCSSHKFAAAVAVTASFAVPTIQKNPGVMALNFTSTSRKIKTIATPFSAASSTAGRLYLLPHCTSVGMQTAMVFRNFSVADGNTAKLAFFRPYVSGADHDGTYYETCNAIFDCGAADRVTFNAAMAYQALLNPVKTEASCAFDLLFQTEHAVGTGDLFYKNLSVAMGKYFADTKVPIGAITNGPGGTFAVGEVVTETTSGATGECVSATAGGYIYLRTLTATAFVGLLGLTGGTTGATATGTGTSASGWGVNNGSITTYSHTTVSSGLRGIRNVSNNWYCGVNLYGTWEHAPTLIEVGVLPILLVGDSQTAGDRGGDYAHSQVLGKLGAAMAAAMPGWIAWPVAQPYASMSKDTGGGSPQQAMMYRYRQPAEAVGSDNAVRHGEVWMIQGIVIVCGAGMNDVSSGYTSEAVRRTLLDVDPLLAWHYITKTAEQTSLGRYASPVLSLGIAAREFAAGETSSDLKLRGINSRIDAWAFDYQVPHFNPWLTTADPATLGGQVAPVSDFPLGSDSYRIHYPEANGANITSQVVALALAEWRSGKVRDRWDMRLA